MTSPCPASANIRAKHCHIGDGDEHGGIYRPVLRSRVIRHDRLKRFQIAEIIEGDRDLLANHLLLFRILGDTGTACHLQKLLFNQLLLVTWNPS